MDDPVTQLGEAAVGLHELYVTLLQAGFTEAQAMELVKAWLVEIIRGRQT